MTKSYQFFRWFPGDAETDEKYASLSLEELGLFHRCLNLSWVNDGLPEMPEAIAALLRIDQKQFLKLWTNVGRMFYLTDTIHPRRLNKRLEMERAHALAKSASASKSVSVREQTKIERSSNDHRTIIERSSNDPRATADVVHLRASVSESASESVSPGGAGGAAAVPLLTQTEWPLTTAELIRHDPAVDQRFVLRLTNGTAQALISAGDMEPFDDEDMATAIKESYEGYHGKRAHGNGLLLSRVPQIMLNWGKDAKENGNG